MANSILDQVRQHEDVFSLPEDVLNSFVQSASLDVDHLVGALGLEIGKSSQPPAPSEGKPPLPQPALPTSQARLRSWRGLALSCLRGNQLVLCFKRQSAIALQVCLSNVNDGNCFNLLLFLLLLLQQRGGEIPQCFLCVGMHRATRWRSSHCFALF